MERKRDEKKNRKDMRRYTHTYTRHEKEKKKEKLDIIIFSSSSKNPESNAERCPKRNGSGKQTRMGSIMRRSAKKNSVSPVVPREWTEYWYLHVN